MRGWMACVGWGLLLVVGCRVRERPEPAQPLGAKGVRLDGTYGVREGAEIVPMLKVEETKTGYVFEERVTGEWRVDGQVPHVATVNEVHAALDVDATKFPCFGLATDSAYLLQVPAGTSVKGVTTKSGFLLVSGGRVQATQKVELGSR